MSPSRRIATRLHARAVCASARPPRLIEIAPPPEAAISGAHSLWANLLGLHRPWHRRLVLGQPHVTFEYRFGDVGMRIRMWVPGEVPQGLVEHAIEAAWPGARAATTDLALLDAAESARLKAPFPVGRGTVEGGRLVQRRREAVPVRTKFDGDPHRALFGAMATLQPGESACVQVLARPASSRRVRSARRSINALPGRRRSTAGRGGFALGILRGLLDTASPTTLASGMDTSASSEEARALALVRDPRTEADARAAAAKLAGPQWECVIRYAATALAGANSTGRARGLSHALGSAWAVFAERNYYRRRRLPHPAQTLEHRAFRSGLLAHRGGRLHSLEELAAIAHLPCDLIVPGLARAGARPIAPSTCIPSGRDGGAAVKTLGVADCGPVRPVALPVADARHHLHVIGKTGVGKSTLLANLALADIEAGRGLTVIDPKGDLITEILERLPDGAEGRLVLIDPEAAGDPPRLNVLDGQDPDTAVDSLVATFRRIYHSSWGPRTDDLLRAACLTLLYAAREKKSNPAQRGAEVQPDPTLVHVLTLISKRELLEKYLSTLGDEHAVLQAFWAWYGGLSEAGAAAVSAPLLNKLRAVLLRDFPRRVLAAGPSDIDVERVLDGGILLVRLPKGAIGEESTRLLGSLLVSRLWQALCARSRLGRERPDCTLIMDEFQNFLHQAISAADMLAEARGHGMSIVAAHQDLDQLGPELREAISANARNKVFFSLSPEDARFLERHTLPHLTAYDLSHLGAFQAAARLVIESAEQPACTLATRPLPAPIPGRAQQMRGTDHPDAEEPA
jgi:hypothetical protein